MHVLSESDVVQILDNLTQSQCHKIMNNMVGILSLLSAESKPSVPASEKSIRHPQRTILNMSENRTHAVMPMGDKNNLSIKAVTVNPSGVEAVINIFSSEGHLQGLLGATEFTAFRTALATMILFVRCPMINKENIVVLGSGRQAVWHARLALLLFPGQIRHVTFINRGQKRLAELDRDVISALRKEHPSIIFTTLAKENTANYGPRLAEELDASDVIFSCTPSTEPNFSHSALMSNPKRRFISLIGSYQPHMHEIDTDTLLSGGGKIFVDSKTACLVEAGELIDANIREEQLVEIGELQEGSVQIPDEGNIIYKCVGVGIMDLVIGKDILNIGEEMRVGTQISGF